MARVSVQSNQKVLCAVGDLYNSFEGKIFEIKPDFTIENLPWMTQTLISSIWMKDENRLYACGNGIWVSKVGRWYKYGNVTDVLWFCIRGNEINDIFVCGDFGYIAHFNGLSWKSYQFPNHNLIVSLDVQDDLIVAVSWDGGLIMGRRTSR